VTVPGDPHRTLGVAPGASLNEIRSAYRRLVKRYHPDAAGERALPRFLAIQAAYELLVDGEGRLRTGDRRPASGRADPASARASRDAWRARRSGAGRTDPAGGTRPESGAGANGRDGPAPGPASPGSAPGSAQGNAGHARPGARHGRARSAPRKATPGSTTYDEAAEIPLDPAWEGGAWYGPSSGTYWTLNPREYADPRKHGPEYLERARRGARHGARQGAGPGSGPGASRSGASPTGDPPRRHEPGS
jgi:curved DNA-binding protein CbpA